MAARRSGENRNPRDLCGVAEPGRFSDQALFHQNQPAFGAKTEDRTRDLPLTMGVLYQLSYLGFFSKRTAGNVT